MLIFQSLTTLIQQLFFIALGMVGIGFLIGFHELGHFLFCKLFNIHTPSFSIGFGPQILKKKIGNTLFSLSAIPLGGYVEIAGAQEVGQGDQEFAQSTEQDSFATKPYYQKMLVISGGILFNLIFAYTIVIALFFMGIPQTPLLHPTNGQTTIKDSPKADTPAMLAGLQTGDTITAMNGEHVAHANLAALLSFIRQQPNKTVTFTITRNNETLNIPVTLGEQQAGSDTVGHLGAFFEMSDIPAQSLAQSFKSGIAQTNTWITLTAKSFLTLFKKKSMHGIGGPVLVLQQMVAGAEKGFKIFLLLLALISINLAVLNLIPLPVFDGGQALFYTIEAIIQRPLPEKIRLGIHYICWIGIILLAIYLTYNDIKNILLSLLGN